MVTCTVVSVWQIGAVAYAEIIVPNPLGGASITFQVSGAAKDAQGNQLSNAVIKANLTADAQNQYQRQFPGAPAALSNPGTIQF